MRWYQKKVRVVKRFALFPIKIGKEYRWFEIVYLKQRYYDGEFFPWGTTSFVTKEDYLHYKETGYVD